MFEIPDDPIIRCMDRTGYPPWMQDYVGYEDDEDEEEEYDSIELYREPFADYTKKAV